MSDNISFQVEESQPKSRNLAVWGLAIVIVFVAVASGIKTVFYRQVAANRHSEANTHRDERLANSRDQQQQRLQTYGWTDKSKGMAHIPIEEAMRLQVEQQQKGEVIK